MPKIDIKYQEIEDQYARENFFRLKKFFDAETFLKGEWEFVEFTVPGAITNYRFKHNLGFQPKDVLVTSTIGAGTVQFNYNLFDKDFLDLTTTGQVTIRAFVGRFEKQGDK